MSALALSSASPPAQAGSELAVLAREFLAPGRRGTLAAWASALREVLGPAIQEEARAELPSVVLACSLANDLAVHGSKPAHKVIAASRLYDQAGRVLGDLTMAARRENTDGQPLTRASFDRLVLAFLFWSGLWRNLCRVCREHLDELRRADVRRRCPAQTSDTFAVHTSQEADALQRALSDGWTGRYWSIHEQAGLAIWSPPGSAYTVEFRINRNERSDGLPASALGAAFGSQSVDAALVVLYVLQLLVPKTPLGEGMYSGAWIDLDEVASKVWPAPRSREERVKCRYRVYAVLAFCARASVIGCRSGTYTDKATGAPISTRIESPIWTVLGQERAYIERITLPFEDDIPLRVELVCSREWAGLMVGQNTAQYLPGGELISSIPGNRPSGALARALGLALVHFWRRTVRQTTDHSLQPSRRELLDHFTPTTGPIGNVLLSRNPSRAVRYWHDAVAKLADVGLIAHEGEAVAGRLDARRRPRYGWQEQWLDDGVDLRPGPMVLPAVAALAVRRAAAKPKHLRAGRAKSRRPRRAPRAHS